jgi:hypothetical protein
MNASLGHAEPGADPRQHHDGRDDRRRREHDPDLDQARSDLVVVVRGERPVALLLGGLGARASSFAAFVRLGPSRTAPRPSSQASTCLSNAARASPPAARELRARRQCAPSSCVIVCLEERPQVRRS